MATLKNRNVTYLSPAEQKTTAAFKLKSAEIKALKQSLKKTQDQLETVRQEKSDLEKRNAVLENNQKNVFWIELFKFISAVGIGFATSYVISDNIPLALSFGVPSIIVFIVALIANNK